MSRLINKHTQLAAAMAVIILAFTACKEEHKVDPVTEKVNELYKSISELYVTYTDSLAHATDSADIEGICSRLDDRIRKVYLAYPAEFDTKLSDAQNEKLWNLAQKYIKLREKRMCPKIVASTDSVASDSANAASATEPGL